MKYYFCGRYSHHKQFQEYRKDLEALGHEVTSRWINGAHQTENDNPEMARRFANEDLNDLDDAEVMLCFPEPSRKPSTNRGGRHVEFGYAIASGMNIVVIGEPENIFHFLADEFYPDWAAFLMHEKEINP